MQVQLLNTVVCTPDICRRHIQDRGDGGNVVHTEGEQLPERYASTFLPGCCVGRRRGVGDIKRMGVVQGQSGTLRTQHVRGADSTLSLTRFAVVFLPMLRPIGQYLVKYGRTWSNDACKSCSSYPNICMCAAWRPHLVPQSPATPPARQWSTHILDTLAAQAGAIMRM